MLTNHSSRKYQVTTDYFENNPQTNIWSIDHLLNEQDYSEERYAMLDVLDRILDLHVGQGMYFQPNRDDKQSFGIIRRIS